MSMTVCVNTQNDLSIDLPTQQTVMEDKVFDECKAKLFCACTNPRHAFQSEKGISEHDLYITMKRLCAQGDRTPASGTPTFHRTPN